MASKKVFAVIGEDSFLFDSFEEFRRYTFSPDLAEKVVFLAELSVKGKTYAEKKANAQDLAREIQINDNGGLSYLEYSKLGSFFETIGKRYGLLEEFRENTII